MESQDGVGVGGDLTAYRSRRERELSSLYATARSLTALGEIDDVLDLVVRHAHELVGTDITYLSLLDSEGELSIRASAGTISPAFRAARLPHGVGIGGRVVSTGAAAWVSNYLAAQDLPHDPSFDRLVDPEGMVALLGVPLLVGNQVIGVLFAADRSERPFSPDEVALLSAFADHAAIAVNNARLYEQSREALQRLQLAYQTIEEQMATLERAQAVHEALTQVVLSGGSPEEVARQLAQYLTGQLTVLRRDNSVLVRCASPGAEDWNSMKIPESLVAAAARSGRCATAAQEDGVVHSVAAIQAGDSYLGALALTSDHHPSVPDERTIERATHIMGLLILKENAVADAAERLSGELLTDLLMSSPSVGPAQRARMLARGIDPDRLTYLIVADCPTLSSIEVSRRLQAVAADMQGLAGEHLGRATLLIPAGGDRESARSVHSRLRQELGRPITVIGELVRGTQWAVAYSIAARCCAIAQAIGPADLGTDARSYSMYGVVFDPERADDLGRFVDDKVGVVLEYDARRTTELVNTLTAYFEHSGSLTKASRSLHIHQNTLLKRLERISALLGDDWRAPDRALELQLALRLLRLQRIATPGAAQQN